MRIYQVILFTFVFQILYCVVGADGFVIVEDGKPQATIIVDENASKQAQLAAKELRMYIERISNVKLRVVSDKSSVEGGKIYIGKHPVLNGLGIKIPNGRTYKLNEEGYVVYCKDDVLVLAGNETPPYEGTYYAVYDLLGQIGCRWYFPGSFGEVVPHRNTIVVKEQNRFVRPVFRIRDAWLDGYVVVKGAKRVIDLWKRRNRFSNHIMFINPREKITPFLHSPVDNSLKDLVPRKVYEKKHPEYYIKRGNRIDTDIPNIADPRIVKLALNTIHKFFEEHPEAISYAFSGPDRAMWSNDERWIELSRGGYNGEGFGLLYGGLDGANWKSDVSDLYFGYFVDRLAREVKRFAPNKWIVTLAYSNRQRPPEGVYKRWDNVIIAIAPLQADPLKSFTDIRSPINMRYQMYFRRWAEISAGIIYYAYDPRDFTMLMRHCWASKVIKSNLKMLKDLNAWGFSIETVIGWLMNGLNHYIYGRLSWDIEADVNEIIKEFCKTFFGPSSEPMEKYYRFVEDTLNNAPCVPFWAGPDDPMVWEIFNQPVRRKCWEYLKEAERLAKKEPYRRRVFVFNQHFRRLDAFCRMIEAMNRAEFEQARKCYIEMAEAVRSVNDKLLLAHKGQFNSLPERYFKLAKDLGSRIDGTKGKLVCLFPEKGYFRADANMEGLTFGWQRESDLSDKWKKIRLDTTWGLQGYKDSVKGESYHGVGWYKIAVNLSAKDIEGKLWLCFPGIYRTNCELWVWVNGKFSGYAKTKYVEPTDIQLHNLREGRNLITIRLFSAGGIYIRPFVYSKGTLQ